MGWIITHFSYLFSVIVLVAGSTLGWVLFHVFLSTTFYFNLTCHLIKSSPRSFMAISVAFARPNYQIINLDIHCSNKISLPNGLFVSSSSTCQRNCQGWYQVCLIDPVAWSMSDVKGSFTIDLQHLIDPHLKKGCSEKILFLDLLITTWQSRRSSLLISVSFPHCSCCSRRLTPSAWWWESLAQILIILMVMFDFCM